MLRVRHVWLYSLAEVVFFFFRSLASRGLEVRRPELMLRGYGIFVNLKTRLWFLRKVEPVLVSG